MKKEADIAGRARRVVAAGLAAFLMTPASAKVANAMPVRARAVLRQTPLVAGGRDTLAISVRITPGYHIQSARPLDKSFVPTVVSAKAAGGVTFGQPRYPRASIVPVLKEVSPSGKLAIYMGHIVILLPLSITPAAKIGPLILHLKLVEQACFGSQACFPPRDIKLTAQTAIVPAGGATQKRARGIFAFAGKQRYLPKIRGSPPAAAIGPATSVKPLAGRASATAAMQLQWIGRQKFKRPNVRFSLLLMLSALLGGMVLNIMPCVLPVIPIKVLTLVEHAHGDRKIALRHGLVFAAGIVSFFAALGLAFGIYHVYSGNNVLYGMQFSDPVVIIGLALVVVAFGLSMLGVWTIGTPRVAQAIDRPSGGYFGSFMMGVLATVLATPCSAPYLGPVIAWALNSGVATAIVGLVLVGVGMAIPYVVLAAFPRWIKHVPRAGRWSELLKQFLGLVMLGVAVYFLAQLPSHRLLVWALFAAAFVGAACWAWGQSQTADTSRTTVWGVRAASIVLAALFSWIMYGLVVPPGAVLAPATATRVAVADPLAGSAHWKRFTVPRLRAAIRLRRPVVIDWTASWCPNCRELEADVLGTAEAKRAFRGIRAVLLRADITSGNRVARALLFKLGSRSIPFVAVFTPHRFNRPILLPDRFAMGTLKAALRRAKNR